MPYNPGVVDRGGEYIARGIESAGQSIGRAIELYAERKKREQDDQKFKQGLVKALSPKFEEFGYGSKEEMLNDNSDDILGRVKGQMVTSAIAEREQAVREHVLRQQVQQEQLTGMKRDREGQEVFARALTQRANPMARDIAGAFNPEHFNPQGSAQLAEAFRQPTERGLTAQDILESAAASGTLTPELALRLQHTKPSGLAVGQQQTLPDGTVLTGLGEDNTPNVRAPQPKAMEIPKGMVPTGATMDENGALKMTFKPEAEGKALTQGETAAVGALSQAENDLNNLEKLFADLGPDWGGPVSGRAKSFAGAGQNKNVRAVENAIVAATPNLARGVFREVGVLTDEDIRRYSALLPGPFDTEDVRKVKMKQLRERLEEGKTETLKSLKAARRDVGGFEADAATAKPKQFDTEESARTAGHKSGDIVLLYNPAKAAYQKFKLD